MPREHMFFFIYAFSALLIVVLRNPGKLLRISRVLLVQGQVSRASDELDMVRNYTSHVLDLDVWMFSPSSIFHTNRLSCETSGSGS